MEILNVRIGEFIFKILLKSVYTLNRLEDFEMLSGEDTNPDIIIELKDGHGEPFKDFNVIVTNKQNKICYHRADYLIEVDKDFKYAMVAVHDELALKHALMNLYSAFILHHNWGLLIHSSCVIENGKAHLFSGQSGAGKSTAAKLSAPRVLYSDEASIIKITSNEITVYNSPFRSEIESTESVGPKPLSSIHLLNQSIQNKRVRLKKSDALIQLMDKVFYWVHSPEETVRIFGLLNHLVENVPVYDLYFQKNNRFWELIS